MAPSAKINTSIRDCLVALQPGCSPIAHLARWLQRLHQDPSWTDEEVRDVEAGVRRILSTLIDDGRDED